MIINEFVNIKIYRQNKEHYIKKGYGNVIIGNEILVNYVDLLPSTKVEIKVICDYCDKEYSMKYPEYYKCVLNGIVKKCACANCRGIKTKESNLIKYGVENVNQLEETKI